MKAEPTVKEGIKSVNVSVKQQSVNHSSVMWL